MSLSILTRFIHNVRMIGDSLFTPEFLQQLQAEQPDLQKIKSTILQAFRWNGNEDFITLSISKLPQLTSVMVRIMHHSWGGTELLDPKGFLDNNSGPGEEKGR